MARALSFRKRYATALARRTVVPSWGEHFSAPAKGRFTWYVALRVRQDFNGQVSDLDTYDIDERARSRVTTVALLGVVRGGARAGELRRVTRAELERDFEDLLEEAVHRHGLVPVGTGSRPVVGIFRHSEG